MWTLPFTPQTSNAARLRLCPQPIAFDGAALCSKRLQVRIGRCGLLDGFYADSQKSDAAAALAIGAMNGIAR